MRKKITVLFAILTSMASLQAQDSLKSKTLSEVVVTGTRFEIPVEKSGKTITKISAETLAQQPARSIGDILNTVPNLQIDGVYGTPGTNLGYYARGAKNRQTVILVDGVPMVDPTGISPEFDLRLLSLDQVNSIEVMRGGLSTLYGSGAAASVINISLKSPGVGTTGSIDICGGSYGTFSQNFAISSGGKKFYFQLMADNTNSTGFSAAVDEQSSGTFDKDGLDRHNGLIRIGYKPTEKIDVQLFGGLDQFSADYDDGAYADADNVQESKQWRAGLKGTIRHNNGQLQATLQQTWLDKEFKSSFPSVYTGYTTSAEVFDTYALSNAFTLVGGVSFQNLAYDQEQAADRDTTHFSIVDPYASLVFDLPNGVNVQVGARLNNHSEYGGNFIYNINPSYLWETGNKTKIKFLGSIATSFITPSLYQLFSEYGNKALNPEEALNFEGGVTFYAGSLTAGVVYFDREETNAIGFQSLFDDDGNFIGGQYYNLSSERNVHGVEIEGSYTFSPHFTIAANYSFVTSDNEISFYRIPETKYTINLRASSGKGGNVTLRYQHTGERKDLDFSSFEEVTLDPFQLIDISISQSFLKEKFNAYLSVNNIFDESFSWAPGFASMGRNFMTGLKYRF